ncbi:hypothetical protein D3C87_685720 [compost metagenome]
MIRSIKKIMSCYFGNGPKGVIRFEKIIALQNKDYVDLPESLTSILKHENGNLQYIKPFINYFKVDFKYRELNLELRYKKNGFFKEADRILYALANGKIFGSLGIIYDPITRLAIYEATKEWFTPLKQHPLFSAIHISSAKKISGNAFSLVATGADGGYYHFIHQALIKLTLCKSQFRYIDHFLLAGPETGWKRKVLEHVGVELKKVIWMSNKDHYQFDQLLFTNSLMTDHQFVKKNIKRLRELMQAESFSSNERSDKVIWISRAGAASRDFKWEKKIKDNFPFIDFIIFEELSMPQVIATCNSCSHIIGPHGAGFSNLIFCKEETKVLEIFSDNQFIPLYSRLSQVCNLTHHAIQLDFENHENAKIGLSYMTRVLQELFNANKLE